MCPSLPRLVSLFTIFPFSFLSVAFCQRPDFATFEASLLNNFMMMFGNFPEDWAGMEFATPLRTELIVYVVLYFLVVFLLMQNFVNTSANSCVSYLSGLFSF